MSPSYADTIDKLVEDNHFRWELNMRMKLVRKGLLPLIIKPKFDQVSDRSTVGWKNNAWCGRWRRESHIPILLPWSSYRL
ncbi:hypothetical protein PI124_g18006 [Phytophthora idaei]|nr:hypothetical protein PI125_g20380 [Phytophthora idaei]KAG3136562.1 hypothetical protein PI126_g17772 [Phytophthora idaei]KAG3236993.1 hypothetical protein PI124_g18006 [Phytophthora idaei]